MSVGYGSHCSEGTCSSRIEVGAEEIPLGQNIVGCSRLAPIHGVPTVSLAGDSVVLFTGPLAIRVGTTPGDVELAAQAAKELRRVGESAAAGTLPPPPASKPKLIDAACGRHPGEHGPGLYDDPALNPASEGMPAFTVPRLGGGQLRWTDYNGKPVVVAAGDVTDVAPAVRRLAKLTSGGKSPTVIGLTWDTVGDKVHPAPTAEIQRKAGHLPVPVGSPATEPAVWLSDAAGIDPSQSGVIGFLDSKGIPSTLLPTDASDAEIRTRAPATSLVTSHYRSPERRTACCWSVLRPRHRKEPCPGRARDSGWQHSWRRWRIGRTLDKARPQGEQWWIATEPMQSRHWASPIALLATSPRQE